MKLACVQSWHSVALPSPRKYSYQGSTSKRQGQNRNRGRNGRFSALSFNQKQTSRIQKRQVSRDLQDVATSAVTSTRLDSRHRGEYEVKGISHLTAKAWFPYSLAVMQSWSRRCALMLAIKTRRLEPARHASARLTSQQHRLAWIPGFSATADRSSTSSSMWLAGER